MRQGFTFRLQSVLDYREHIKQQRTEKLLEYRNQLEEERDALNNLAEVKANLAIEMDNSCSQGIPAGYLAICNKYMEQLNQFIDKRKESLLDAEKRVEKCRIGVMDASRNKEVMERLKERHYKEFMQRMSIGQEKEVEDLVNNRKISP